jgi:hypothetical protein
MPLPIVVLFGWPETVADLTAVDSSRQNVVQLNHTTAAMILF